MRTPRYAFRRIDFSRFRDDASSRETHVVAFRERNFPTAAGKATFSLTKSRVPLKESSYVYGGTVRRGLDGRGEVGVVCLCECVRAGAQ